MTKLLNLGTRGSAGNRLRGRAVYSCIDDLSRGRSGPR